MADDVVKIIRIETGGSEQTVKGLKDEINSLRDALLNTEKGSKEYKDILEQLIADQQKLTEVMSAGKTQISAATGSYNALVNQMAALKKVWRETTDEATRKDLGKQIKSINDQLKGFDASIGDFRRQVGDYTNSITSAFGAMGGAAKGMIGPINGVKTAFNALSAHPLIAVFTGLAALLINGISKGFKSSEENMNKLRTAFSGFKAIGDAVLNMFQGLAGWIAKVAEGAMNLADKLGLVSPKMKARQELTKKQIELEKKERDSLEKTAQLESDSAELRAKASEADKYTTQERIKFLQEAQAKDEERLNLEKEILEEKVAQLEAEMALTQSSSEEYRKLNELKAQVIKINAQISASQRQTNKEIIQLRRRGLQEQTKANQERLNLEKDLLQQEYDLAVEGSDEQLRLAKELRKKELEIQQEGFKTKIKNRKEYDQAMKLASQAYNNDIDKLEKDFAIKAAETTYQETMFIYTRGLREGTKEWYDAMADATNEYIKKQEELGKRDEETDTLFEKRIEDLKKRVQEFKDLGIQVVDEATEVANQIALNQTTPLTKYYAKQSEMLRAQYDSMVKLSTESDDEFTLRRQEMWKQIIEIDSHWAKAVIDHYDLMDKIASKEIAFESPLVQYFYQLDPLYALNRKVEDDKEKFKAILGGINKFIVDQSQYITDLMPDMWSKLFGDLGFGFTPENIQALFDRNYDVLKENTERFKDLSGEALITSVNDLQDLIRNTLMEQGLIPDELIDTYFERLQTLVDGEKEIVRQSVDTWSERAQAIAQLCGSVADAYEAELKFQVKTEKMSEEAAKDEFDTVKGLRIAMAIIDTIQGSIAAFMGWQDKGQPWGAIIGAVQAAAVAASGWAQIRQIQMTEFGGSGSSMGGGTPMASVTPVMMDYQPQLTGNVTGQQEAEELANAITSKPIRAYVVESDISNAQQLANQRASESTF